MPDFIHSIAKICKNNNDVHKIPFRQLRENNHLTFHFKGVISAKMVKIIKFLFFAQKVSSGMGALRPKFLGG